MVPIISPSFTLSPIFTLRFISCPCDVATTSCISPPNNTPTTFNFVLIENYNLCRNNNVPNDTSSTLFVGMIYTFYRLRN